MPMKSILLKLFEKNAALLFVNTKVLTSQNHRYHLGRLFLRERFSNLLFRTCSSLMYSKVMYPREGGEKHAHTNGKCNYLNKRHGVLNTKKKRRVDQSRPLVKQHNTISTLAATLTVIFLNYWCITNKFFISSADAYGCKIEVSSTTALAKARYNNQQSHPTYSCTPGNSSTQYEVHILSVYEAINRLPLTAGNASVNIVSRGKSNRPIVLVLASYEPVNWILNLPTNISISKVLLVSTFAHRELDQWTHFSLEHWLQFSVNVAGMPRC